MTDLEQMSIDLSAELADGDAEQRALEPVDPCEVPSRHSLLKQMALSPAHYYEACQHPQDESLAGKLGALSNQRTRTEALRFGTAVHYMLLGEEHKVARYCGRRQGKVWTEFQRGAREGGANEILNEREHASATEVAGAIRRHREAMRLLFDGTEVEQRLDWTWMGKAMRSTPDAYKRGDRIVDLKTSVSSAIDTFQRHALRLFYHAQAALYCHAAEELGHPPVNHCYLVAVEKSAPYPVTVFRLTENTLDIGRRLCRLWMERLLICEASGQWPPYAEDVVDFDIDGDRGVELSFGGKAFTYGD